MFNFFVYKIVYVILKLFKGRKLKYFNILLYYKIKCLNVLVFMFHLMIYNIIMKIVKTCDYIENTLLKRFLTFKKIRL